MNRHTVYIDVSAKIEQWDKPSALAMSDGISRVLWITPELKQRARALVLGAEPTQYVLLAALAYLAVRPDLGRIKRIVLDQDYSGNVARRLIVRRLVELIRCDDPHFKASHIRIERVAESQADRLARQTFKGKMNPDRLVTWEELEGILRQ